MSVRAPGTAPNSANTTPPTMVDAIILGGGPVGCLLAVLLSRMGVSNMLVERDPEPYQLPRAIVMDDEIQRALHDHGLGEWLMANTTPLARGDFVSADGTVIVGGDVPPMGLQGLPPVVCHYQPELDAMLRSEAARLGSITRFGNTVSDMVDRGDCVTTTLDSGEVVESRWFVGCDGASSWTRRHTGLVLEDLRFDQEWLVVDVELSEGATVDLPVGVRQYCDPVRPATFVQGHRAFRRWEFQVQEHEDSTVLNTPDGLWRLLSPWLTRDQARLVRSAVYRFHAVVAPTMQKGNVFLAGDSGHQMPPFLGQGLNSGMRDALNLSWKMAFVVRGLAGSRLLDTYSIERVPHVRSTVAHAADVGRLIDQLAGRESHGIDNESGYGGARPGAHIEAGVVTGDDPRVGHQFWFHPDVSAATVHGGASFVVVSNEPIDMPDELVALGARAVVAPGATGGAHAIVVRPDRYVAAVATDADLLQHAAQALGSAITDPVEGETQ